MIVKILKDKDKNLKAAGEKPLINYNNINT